MKKLLFLAMMCLMALSMSAQKCAVLEFRGSASVSVADIDGISEMFMTYFRPAGYTMIERAQIDKVISEQRFQRSNITDNQAVQLGKILNASVVILGKISMLGGQYQVDVRAVDVQSGHDIAFEGATFSGDFRTNVKNLATKLAGKVAITSGGTVNPTPSQPAQQAAPTTRNRSGVEVLYGYLKIFPHELGFFEAEPSTVIAQINKQAQHGYNSWRIPTNEELSLLRANNYLGNGQYMTKERPNGIVLLVTDGDDYATIQKAEEEARKAKEEARKAMEAHKASLLAQGYVDLGLPSGTMWKNQNEEGGWYTYDEAVSKFKDALPTVEQFRELREKCTWTLKGSNYKIEGSNGNFIILPISSGLRRCDGTTYFGQGNYWSIEQKSSERAFELFIHEYGTGIESTQKCYGQSVRLVAK